MAADDEAIQMEEDGKEVIGIKQIQSKDNQQQVKGGGVSLQ